MKKMEMGKRRALKLTACLALSCAAFGGGALAWKKFGSPKYQAYRLEAQAREKLSLRNAELSRESRYAIRPSDLESLRKKGLATEVQLAVLNALVVK
jgi:hypothetical protein